MNIENIEKYLREIFNEDEPIANQLHDNLQRINREIEQGTIKSYKDIYDLLATVKYLENRLTTVNNLYNERRTLRGTWGDFNVSNFPVNIRNYNNYINLLMRQYVEIHINLMNKFGLAGIIGIHGFFESGNQTRQANAEQANAEQNNRSRSTSPPQFDPRFARENFRSTSSSPPHSSSYSQFDPRFARENFRSKKGNKNGQTRRNTGTGAAANNKRNKRNKRNNRTGRNTGTGAPANNERNNRTRRKNRKGNINKNQEFCLKAKNISDIIIETYDENQIHKGLLDESQNNTSTPKKNAAEACYKRIKENLVSKGVLDRNNIIITSPNNKKSVKKLFLLIHTDRLRICNNTFNHDLFNSANRANQIINNISYYF
mgnify:CR=1 FL=1